MVDRASYFEFTPGVLQGLACGDVRPCHRPHSRSLTRAKLLRVPPNAVLRVGDHELSAESGEPATAQTVPFDFLILATGSSYPAPIKPSGSESVRLRHACSMRAHIADSFASQDATQRAADVAKSSAELAAARDVLIIGGGVVGVELAAEIATRQKQARVTVADVAPRLLATLPPVAGDKAAAMLVKAGVRLLLGAPLTRVAGGDGVRSEYSTPGGDAVAADVVYMCVGARPNSGCFQSSVALDARGCVPCTC